jgi:hypothetical protein
VWEAGGVKNLKRIPLVLENIRNLRVGLDADSNDKPSRIVVCGAIFIGNPAGQSR